MIMSQSTNKQLPDEPTSQSNIPFPPDQLAAGAWKRFPAYHWAQTDQESLDSLSPGNLQISLTTLQTFRKN